MVLHCQSSWHVIHSQFFGALQYHLTWDKSFEPQLVSKRYSKEFSQGFRQAFDGPRALECGRGKFGGSSGTCRTLRTFISFAARCALFLSIPLANLLSYHTSQTSNGQCFVHSVTCTNSFESLFFTQGIPWYVLWHLSYLFL